ncbi:hypothetical protein C8R44DRAFT_987477 [Mycena epipterygia]|nr:hypothetical protein C8R44DRAFT_987477 [Mycena epipterygia]
MHSASTTVATVQKSGELSVAVANQHKGTDATPVNDNGPQCAHCGWRGGEHASNCPFK